MNNHRVAALLVLLLMLTLSSADNVSDTLTFLQSFATQFPNALASWTGTDYCGWDYVDCTNGTLQIYFASQSSLDSSGTLPEAESDDILVTSLDFFSCFADGTAFTLPASWSRLKRLDTLYFTVVPRLTGTLPASWGSLKALRALQIAYTNVSGTLPPEWSGMSSLVQIAIGYNPMQSGTLPAEWSAMENMLMLVFMNCPFTGTFPKEWFNMSLLWLVLSGTQLSGTLPSEFASFSGLTMLYLGNTSFSGTLPSAWSGLLELESLQLNDAKLSGTLPASWGDAGSLPKLAELLLTGNNFSGCEPDSWKNVTVLHNAIADMPVALANCSLNNGTGDENSGDGAHANSVWTAALVLFITTSLFL